MFIPESLTLFRASDLVYLILCHSRDVITLALSGNVSRGPESRLRPDRPDLEYRNRQLEAIGMHLDIHAQSRQRASDDPAREPQQLYAVCQFRTSHSQIS